MEYQQDSLPEDSFRSRQQPTIDDQNALEVDSWQVLDVDNQLEKIEHTSGESSLARESLLPDNRHDEVIVASLATRQLTVNPGGTVVLQVTLLNNGAKTARFHLSIDSDLDERWIDPVEQSIQLQPGEGSVLDVTIHPPRAAVARAGLYELNVRVDASEYSGRFSELYAEVEVAPFSDYVLGQTRPQTLTVNALRRVAAFAVPITNLGNAPITLLLDGLERGRRFRYQFAQNLNHEQSQPTLRLAPGQSTVVQVALRPLQRTWVGTQPRQLRTGLLAAIADEERAPRLAPVTLYDLPVFGIWTLAGLAAAAVLLVIGLIAASVLTAGIWWVRQLQVAQLSQVPAQMIVQQAPSVQQPMIVVVPMNSSGNAEVNSVGNPNQQQAGNQSAQLSSEAQSNRNSIALPTPTPEPLRNAATFTQQGAAALTAPVGEGATGGANVPVIGVANVTTPSAVNAPGLTAPQPQIEAEAVQPQVVQPQVVQPQVAQPQDPQSQPANRPAAQLTFAQMFQEIGLQYDLNWRMLAAQAYIESGFDSLALGNDGDMGLMQILPDTWKEFAPQVGAKDAFESYSNVTVAAVYLDHLRSKLSDQGYPQTEWMLIAYNWGPDKVLTFLADGGTWETLTPERKRYAEEVLRIAATIP